MQCTCGWSGVRLLAVVRGVLLPAAALAGALAASQPPVAVVHLHGDLGAGKSTLARAWLRALGVTGPVRSPTYTLVERYPLQTGGEALHLDLYRIGDAGELEFLGLDDADARLWLVEWPERAGEEAWPHALALSLDFAPGDARILTAFVPPSWEDRWPPR